MVSHCTDQYLGLIVTTADLIYLVTQRGTRVCHDQPASVDVTFLNEIHAASADLAKLHHLGLGLAPHVAPVTRGS